MVEFSLSISNNSRCTWSFDFVEALSASDSEGNNYKETYKEDLSFCPRITLSTGETKYGSLVGKLRKTLGLIVTARSALVKQTFLLESAALHNNFLRVNSSTALQY